jgi:hypothetical protein
MPTKGQSEKSSVLDHQLQLLVLRCLGKLNTLVDVAFQDRDQVINTLLLNTVQLTKPTYLLYTTGT